MTNEGFQSLAPRLVFLFGSDNGFLLNFLLFKLCDRFHCLPKTVLCGLLALILELTQVDWGNKIRLKSIKSAKKLKTDEMAALFSFQLANC